MTSGFRQAEFHFGPNPGERTSSQATRAVGESTLDLRRESLPSPAPESASESGGDATSPRRDLPPEPPVAPSAANGPADLWRSLGPKDRFAVPARRFSGEVGPVVYVVRERKDDGSLVVVREGKRKRFVASLNDGETVVLREERPRAHSFSIHLGKPVPAPAALEVLTLPPRPENPHPLYEAAERNLKKLEARLENVRSEKARRVLDRHRRILARAATLGHDDSVPRDLEHEYHWALAEAREYLHGRHLSATRETRKEESERREIAERQSVRSDTGISDLPSPDPSETVRRFPEALSLFEHLRERRLVDSITISNYPIGRAIGGLPAPRGHLHAEVEYDAGRNAWRTVTRTTKALSGALCEPKRSTFSPFPIYIVEPQEEERGVILEFRSDRVSLRWVNGKVDLEYRVPPKPYDADPEQDEKGKQHEAGLQALLELHALAESRRVGIRVEAKDLASHLERNRALLDTLLERKAAQYTKLVEEVSRRLDQVRLVSDPGRLGSQAQKSYAASRRILRNAGVDPDTGSRTGSGTLDRIETLFRRHRRELPEKPLTRASEFEARSPEDRLDELKRLDDRKPSVRLTEAERRLGQFMTPHPLAFRVALLGDVHGKTVLDPTCGEGRLLRYALELGASRALGVEVDSRLASYASRTGATVRMEDFLASQAEGLRADVLLMNPPFTTGGPDTIGIVRKAIEEHWTGLGRVVLILPNGRTGSETIEPYLDLVVLDEGLPPDTFKKEGTTVATRLFVLER